VKAVVGMEDHREIGLLICAALRKTNPLTGEACVGKAFDLLET